MKSCKIKGKTVKHRLIMSIPQNGDVNDCYAVTAENNVLRVDKAWERLTNRNVSMGFLGRCSRGYVTYSSNKLFFFDGELNEFAELPEYIRRISVTGFRDNIVFSINGNGTYVLDDGGNLTRTTANFFPSVTSCGERLFGLALNKLYFGLLGSLKLDYECDSITLPSDCDAIIGFDRCVYALGKSCYKIYSDADITKIKVEKIADGLSGVIERSVAVVGDRIVFATSSGLYVLYNDKLTSICGGLTDSLDLSDCRGSVYDGRYVLADYKTTKTALLIDVDKGKCVRVFQKGLTEVYTYANETAAIFVGGQLKKLSGDYDKDACFKRSGIDFKTTADKYLRYVTVKTANPIDLYITGGKETRLRHIKGRSITQRIPIVGCGKDFSLSVRASGETAVELLELTAETYEEADYGN